jgi:hypothetical protein
LGLSYEELFSGGVVRENAEAEGLVMLHTWFSF